MNTNVCHIPEYIRIGLMGKKTAGGGSDAAWWNARCKLCVVEQRSTVHEKSSFLWGLTTTVVSTFPYVMLQN